MGEHPCGAAPWILNLCQSTLKLFWGLAVAQSPAKTLTIDVSSFWLLLSPTLAHLSPYLLPPSSVCLPHGRMKWEGACLCVCLYGCICVCLCVCVSHTLQWAGADACVNNLWVSMKMRKVVLDCKCLFSAESPTLFTSIKLSFFPSIQEAVRMVQQQCNHSPTCLSKTAWDLGVSLSRASYQDTFQMCILAKLRLLVIFWVLEKSWTELKRLSLNTIWQLYYLFLFLIYKIKGS